MPKALALLTSRKDVLDDSIKMFLVVIRGCQGIQEVRTDSDVFQNSGAMWPRRVTSGNHRLRGRALHPKLEAPDLTSGSRSPLRAEGRERGSLGDQY